MLFTHGWVDIVTLCATICLLAVFAVAAVAKLRDMQRARDELVQFGVPERWSRALLGTLVAVELLLAVLLAFPTTRAAGAWGALIASDYVQRCDRPAAAARPAAGVRVFRRAEPVPDRLAEHRTQPDIAGVGRRCSRVPRGHHSSRTASYAAATNAVAAAVGGGRYNLAVALDAPERPLAAADRAARARPSCRRRSRNVRGELRAAATRLARSAARFERRARQAVRAVRLARVAGAAAVSKFRVLALPAVACRPAAATADRYRPGRDQRKRSAAAQAAGRAYAACRPWPHKRRAVWRARHTRGGAGRRRRQLWHRRLFMERRLFVPCSNNIPSRRYAMSGHPFDSFALWLARDATRRDVLRGIAH